MIELTESQTSEFLNAFKINHNINYGLWRLEGVEWPDVGVGYSHYQFDTSPQCNQCRKTGSCQRNHPAKIITIIKFDETVKLSGRRSASFKFGAGAGASRMSGVSGVGF